jgi:hypothetical protein
VLVGTFADFGDSLVKEHNDIDLSPIPLAH